MKLQAMTRKFNALAYHGFAFYTINQVDFSFVQSNLSSNCSLLNKTKITFTLDFTAEEKKIT